MKNLRPLLSSLLCAVLLPFAAAQTATAPSATPTKADPSAAIEKKDTTGAFRKAHESFLARGKAGPIGVLFIGDSITAGWTKAPHIWEHYYGKFQPANFGIGGDRTQHVIWRIENGELEGLRPKVTVLMIGTNNSANDTAAEITAANTKIIGLIRRGARKDADGNLTAVAVADAEKRTAVINAVNADLAKLDDGVSVRFLDIAKVFYGQDGKIPHAIMPDQLHPNAAGYQLWADAMKPLLAEMLK
jgi:lysophospholipase L1-like esterase